MPGFGPFREQVVEKHHGDIEGPGLSSPSSS